MQTLASNRGIQPASTDKSATATRTETGDRTHYLLSKQGDSTFQPTSIQTSLGAEVKVLTWKDPAHVGAWLSIHQREFAFSANLSIEAARALSQALAMAADDQEAAQAAIQAGHLMAEAVTAPDLAQPQPVEA